MQLTDQELEQITEKLAKLKALKDQPGTVGEAGAAMAAIQRILEKNNLSMADFDFNKSDKKTNLKERYGKTTRSMGAKIFLEWRQQLMFVLCAHNYCRAFMWKNGADCEIIGKPENIKAVWEMYDWIVDQVRRLCNDGWKAKGYGSESSWRNGFYFGAVDEIDDRLQEIRDQVRKETQGSTALVVRLEDELKEAVYEHKPHLRPLSEEEKKAQEAKLAALGIKPKKPRKMRVKKLNGAGYMHGQQAGKQVDIQKGLK